LLAVLDSALLMPLLLSERTAKNHVPEVRLSTTYVLIEGFVTSPHMAVSENGALAVAGLSFVEQVAPPPVWSWSTAPEQATSIVSIGRQP
jgi:hypothetical protein